MYRIEEITLRGAPSPTFFIDEKVNGEWVNVSSHKSRNVAEIRLKEYQRKADKRDSINLSGHKSWWAGDPRVEKFMAPVRSTLEKYHAPGSAKSTDIYNRAYEAVFAAIKEYSGQ